MALRRVCLSIVTTRHCWTGSLECVCATESPAIALEPAKPSPSAFAQYPRPSPCDPMLSVECQRGAARSRAVQIVDRSKAPRSVGGSRRRSSARTSRALVVLSSLVLVSPVVVRVLRLLFGLRSVRSEGAARAERRAARARRARRTCISGGSSPPQSSRGARALWSSPPWCFSRPVCRAPRAPLPRSSRAPAGARSPRAGARRTQNTNSHAGRGPAQEKRRRLLSGAPRAGA